MDCTLDQIDKFIPINQEYLFPGKISNSIIDLSSKSNVQLISKTLSELDLLGCKYIQFRCFLPIDFGIIERLVNHIINTRIVNIELLLYFEKEMLSSLINLAHINKRISRIILHSVPIIENLDINNELFFLTNQQICQKSCGVVNQQYFAPNINHVIESTLHNTCLNQKISIDEMGKIKNCPSMNNDFGSIENDTLLSVIENKEFTKFWYLDKSQIDICKECEFRNICTDCRAFIEEPDNLYSKPLKCGYNPQTCQWENWTENPIKFKAINFYNLIELTNKK